MRNRQLFALVALLATAGCGAATTVTTSGTPAGSTPTPQGVTPPPTAAPTPLPAGPLAVLDSERALQVVDGTGHPQWSLTTAAVNTLVSADPNTSFVRISPIADNVLVFADHFGAPTPKPGTVSVIDHTGKVIGSGTFDSAISATDVAADPSGMQWAWSVDDTTGASGQHHGRIMVAGLGTAEHSVYRWVAPVGSTESVGAWTDMGIVMKRFAFGGCGAGFFGDGASFLVDPTAGTLADLFTGDHYLDARHGTRVSRAVETRSEVFINGTPFDESGTIVEGAYVSPDGTLVGVARLTPVACAGETRQPKLGTELVTVTTGAHVDRSGCLIAGWFDATHYACRSFSNAVVTLNDLSGNTVATLGTGAFLGVLQSAQ